MSAKATVMLFVISVILAKIISVFLESPFRFETLKVARRKGLIAVAYGATAVLLFAGVNGSFSKGDDSLLEMDKTHSALYYTNCHTEGPVPIIKGCYFADKASDKTVMLVGDSHAAQYFPGLELAAKSAHYKLLSTTKSACPAILLGKTASNRDKSCYEWQVNIIDAIKRIHPNILVISNFTERTNDQFSIGITPKEFADLQTEFLLRVQKFAGKVVYIDDSPLPGLYGVACLENNRKHLSRCDLPNTKTITSKKVEEQVRNLGVQIVDSRSFLCKGNICPAVIGRKNVYRDSTHISAHIYKVVAKGLEPIFS